MNPHTRTHSSAVLLVLSIWLQLSSEKTYADLIVVPNNLTNVEGNFNNEWPFSGGGSQRYQQVYVSSQFAPLPQFITQIAFRPDGVFGGAFSGTIANVQIDLSTTSAMPNGLSLTFADNVGPNDTVVHSGPLTLSSAFTGPTGGPKDFDIVINLQTPFLYAPSAGNLLLDVRNLSGEFLGALFDAEDSGIVTSRRATPPGPGAVFQESVPEGFEPTIGLVTRFTVVPEPSTLAMSGTAALLLLGYAWWRRARQAATWARTRGHTLPN